jgi:hypothetical protein
VAKTAANPLTYRDAFYQAMGPGVMSNVVPPDVAKRIKMPVSLPQGDEFTSAVQGTKGTQVTPEGLLMNVVRNQKPEQELAESVRTGVFYLPEGSAARKFYKSGDSGYGGSQSIEGQTLLKNPLFVKGATGGKAPEEAYKSIVGKEGFAAMQNDLFKTIQAKQKNEAAYDFLEKYAPEIADNAWNIVQNSGKGNQLRYALQEAVIANAARQKGYDSVLGYSKGRGDKGNFFSEVFDLREGSYPSPSGGFELNDFYRGLLTD